MPAKKKAAAPEPGIQEQTFFLSNQGILDLSLTNPEYVTSIMQGAFYQRTQAAAALHKRVPVITDYDRQSIYGRNGAAQVIIDDPPDALWVQGITTEDAAVTKRLERDMRILRRPLTVAHKWGRLYGLGMVVLGFNDGRPLAAPVGKADKLVWAHAFNRRHIDRIEFEDEDGTPGYGTPRRYYLRATRPGDDSGGTLGPVPVHASRILPIIERPEVHPILGGSRLDRVYDDCEDWAGIKWGSGEGFITRGSPPMVLRTQRPMTPKQEQVVDGQVKGMRSGNRDLVKMLSSMELTVVEGSTDLPDPIRHAVVVCAALSQGSGIPFGKFWPFDVKGRDAADGLNAEWTRFIGLLSRGVGAETVQDYLSTLNLAGILTEEQALTRIRWEPFEAYTRDDLATIVRNESIGLATAGPTGFVPRDAMPRFEKAPPGFIVDTKGGDVPPGGAQTKDEQRASSKNLSRGGA